MNLPASMTVRRCRRRRRRRLSIAASLTAAVAVAAMTTTAVEAIRDPSIQRLTIMTRNNNNNNNNNNHGRRLTTVTGRRRRGGYIYYSTMIDVLASTPRGGGDDGDDKIAADNDDGNDVVEELAEDHALRGGGDSDTVTKVTNNSGNDNNDNNNGSFEITMKGDGDVNIKLDKAMPGSIGEMLAVAREKYIPTSFNLSSLTSSSSANQNKATATTTQQQQQQQHNISSKFPVSRHELPHFTLMSTMMFLFVYVCTTIRDTKDTLVVSNCGAEAIPILKLYGVMPCATLFIVAYSKLSNILDKSTLFYVTLIPFFIFYGIFAFVLFPNRDVIHFTTTSSIGGGGGGGGTVSNLLKHWSFSLYFIISELWASAGVSLLFWQCANDVTPLIQAKRFYPLFAITGNLGPIVSGKVMSYVISRQQSNDDVGFGYTLKTLAAIKGMACLGIIALHRRVYGMAEERVLKERTEKSLSTIRKIQESGKVEITMEFKKPKQKLTLRQSASELMASRELKAMATMVFSYNVCVELTEVLWKAILRRTYPNKSDYMAYMARFSQTVGIVAFFLQLVASEILTVLGWKWTAMIPPVTMGILAAGFFASVIAGEEHIPLAQALLIGTIQNVVNKVTKYSLFDPCKEMAYIPLGPDAKVKGKAAVDVLGARMGRSMGSATQQLMVALVGGPNSSIMNCAPYLGGCYLTAIVMWSNAVSVLGRVFDNVDTVPRDTQRLEQIGEAITIIKSIEDAKREKNKKREDNTTTGKDEEQKKTSKKVGK